MIDQTTKENFLESAKHWVCDSYSLGIYYLATCEAGITKIVDAALLLHPLPPDPAISFSVRAGALLAGQEIFSALSSIEILSRLEAAARGEITINGETFYLAKQTELNYYSEQSHKDTWFTELHLQITGDRLRQISSAEASQIDTALRNATPPFDGIEDLGNWLRLADRRVSGRESAINIRLGPPVDMLFDRSSVDKNVFTLAFSAHPNFDISKIGVSIREFPGKGLESRKHVGASIGWKRPKGGLRSGFLKTKLLNADSVLAMLTLGQQTIRRQWFADPDKASNIRYLTTQFFDKDLKQLRQVLLDSSDSVRFEQGVASLLYLLGFANAIQVETQAPDILVTSPAGKIAIIECTTKISDFQNKLGKLVDRRNALLASLNATGNVHRVAAFLICGLPKLQIAAEDKLLAQHQVTLLCRENLAQGLLQLRLPTDPDEMLDRAVAQLVQSQNMLSQ